MSPTRDGPRVILLTGASTGLGLCIARRLLAQKSHVILTARASSMERFERAGISPSEHVWLRPLDVTSPAEREAVVAEAVEHLGGVDVLINNAGISYRSVIEHVTDEERFHQMQVNYIGPIALVRLVLPQMREHRMGRIIQISSAGGFMAMPTMGVYAASKFALEGASEALYYEMRPFGIKVSLVLPGFINSEGFKRTVLAGASKNAMIDEADPYHAHYQRMATMVARLMRLTPTDEDHVARTVVRTMNARWPKVRVPGSWDMRVLWMLRRLLPQRIYHEVLYRALPGIETWGLPTKR